MYNEKWKAYAAIPSYGRPHSVPRMNKVLGNNGNGVTWYVRNQEEADAYKAAGAKNIKITTTTLEEGKSNLVQKRNEILRDAWTLGYPAMMISDDLSESGVSIVKEGAGTKGKKHNLGEIEVSFDKMVEYFWAMWDGTFPGLMLGGTAPVCNPHFYHGPVKTDLFIIGDFIVVKPCGVFFDERFKFKSDYDYTLEHLTAYGGAFRCDDIFLRFTHYGNRGGQVVFRNDEAMQAADDLLNEKWPGHITKHPKRENEILLKWKPDRSRGELNGRELQRRTKDKVDNGSVELPDVEGKSPVDNNRIKRLHKLISENGSVRRKNLEIVKLQVIELLGWKKELMELMGEAYVDPELPVVSAAVDNTQTTAGSASPATGGNNSAVDTHKHTQEHTQENTPSSEQIELPSMDTIQQSLEDETSPEEDEASENENGDDE